MFVLYIMQVRGCPAILCDSKIIFLVESCYLGALKDLIIDFICSHNQISMWIQCCDKSDFFLCLEFMKCLSNLIICNSGDEGMEPRLRHSLFPNSIYTHLITAEAYHRRLMLTAVEQLIQFLLQLCT
ncbi:hypothetical protein NC651_039381 [Populus alba x Populus x berolinensis]|nr:hypothetical protein NC651_039381 [Populus alba x Populus x berolinensis]